MAVTLPATPTVANATSVALPAHAVGDLIVIFTYNGASTTQPSVPGAGGTVPTWVDQSVATAGNSNCSQIYAAVATATNHTSGTWTNASGIVAVVATGGTTLGGKAAQNGTTGITAPAVTQSDTSGAALLVQMFGTTRSSSVTWNAPAAGYTTQASTSGAVTAVLVATKNASTSDGSMAVTANGGTQTHYTGAQIEILPTAGGTNATVVAVPGIAAASSPVPTPAVTVGAVPGIANARAGSGGGIDVSVGPTPAIATARIDAPAGSVTVQAFSAIAAGRFDAPTIPLLPSGPTLSQADANYFLLIHS